ncbi:hypothetical protein GCM10023238_15530 [Streptomyces heliomycini]
MGVALVTLGLLMLLYPLTRGRELGWPTAVGVRVDGRRAGGLRASLVAYERVKGARDGAR